MSTPLEKKLLKYAENNLNSLLIGTHGIGKSSVVMAIAKKLGLKFKYYSASTLDPYTQLVGVPVPDKDSKTANFFRPKEIQEAEFIMFDELNRAHMRVRNAVLEIIQFKTINGEPLPNLKMVWAAINPPGEDYDVEELDPALVDRFHVFVKMNAEINTSYLKTKISEPIVNVLAEWWRDDLSDAQRKLLTPRRVEYMGLMIDQEIPYRDAFPQGHTFPTKDLSRRLKALKGGEEMILNRDTIINHKEEVLERLNKDPKVGIKVSQVMKKFNEYDIYESRDIMENLPKELLESVAVRKWLPLKERFKELLESNGYSKSDYPKVWDAYGLDNLAKKE